MKRILSDNAKKNIWSTQQAAEWSGIPYMHLLRMAKDGVIPAIPLGPPDQANRIRSSPKKRKFIIPRTAFIHWFENLRPAGELNHSNGNGNNGDHD